MLLWNATIHLYLVCFRPHFPPTQLVFVYFKSSCSVVCLCTFKASHKTRTKTKGQDLLLSKVPISPPGHTTKYPRKFDRHREITEEHNIAKCCPQFAIVKYSQRLCFQILNVFYDAPLGIIQCRSYVFRRWAPFVSFATRCIPLIRFYSKSDVHKYTAWQKSVLKNGIFCWNNALLCNTACLS